MSVVKLLHNKRGNAETVLKNRAVPALIIAVVFCGLLSLLGTTEGYTSATQIKTETIPLGYFELTVSPAEVYGDVGEPVEIRCSIYCLIDTPVRVSSVDVLLFDSSDSMVREQAMVKDSYWSANTVYTIVGDEAYYEIRFNFSFISVSESGEYTYSAEYTECTGASFPIVVSRESS